jgi:hypothetical protein
MGYWTQPAGFRLDKKHTVSTWETDMKLKTKTLCLVAKKQWSNSLLEMHGLEINFGRRAVKNLL